MKQVLTIEQMQHLQKLGLDTRNATMALCMYGDDKDFNQVLPNDQDLFERCVVAKYIPAYTLQDVLELLPRFVIDDEGEKYYLQIEMMNTEFDDWRVSYKSVGYDESPLGYFQAFHLIDAAVRMLVYCFEQGYVKTNKEEQK